MTNKTIGVIGLGQMGSGMAARLREVGYDVRGTDVSPSARDAAAALGIATVAKMEDVFPDRAILLTSLPDPAAVRDVWLGANGIVARAASGTVCIDLSTIDPTTMREVGAAAAEKGLKVLDCPVSGSPKEARAGTLVLIAGGDPAVLDDARDVLRHLGDPIQYTGPVGTAKVVKIVNTMMSMGNVLVAAEAFALGEAAGVDPDTLYDVLSKSGGRSHHFTKRFPSALKGDFSPGFKLELGEKDLALGIELGRQMKMPTPTASAVRELYALALAEGFRGQDIVALLSVYRRWTQSR